MIYQQYPTVCGTPLRTGIFAASPTMRGEAHHFSTLDKMHFYNNILCPRKNPKIEESCKNKAIRCTGAKGQLKNARRNKNRLGFNLPSPSLLFFGFSNGLSIVPGTAAPSEPGPPA